MRILLAEDERSLARAIVALLEKNNYSADAVHDGVEALEYLKSGNYDALILDIMMPRMDGLEVLRRLRAAGNAIPVLLLTAKSEIEDKVTGLDSGANDYLTKPFSTAELMARIRCIFDKAGVIWQTGQLGKVDQGGGGTVAMYLANRNIDTVDAGVPVLSMHAPFECIAKLDLYMAYKGFGAFYRD